MENVVYGWLEKTKLLGSHSRFPRRGAGDIMAFERQLGIPLAPSYSAFLRRWDGASVFGLNIYSVSQVIEWHRANGQFARWTGTLRRSSYIGSDFYGGRPTHFLVVGDFDCAELLCLDTRPVLIGEHPVCVFDGHASERCDKPRSWSFEHFLISTAADAYLDSEDSKIKAAGKRLLDAQQRRHGRDGIWWHRS